MSETRLQLSAEAHARLGAELADLSGDRRSALIAEITAGRGGDVADQAEAAMQVAELERLEARARHITHMLGRADIVEGPTHSDTVVVGVEVALRYEGDEEAETYVVGSSEERGEGAILVTTESPVGRAILGARVGDVVSCATPGGAANVEIVAIGA